MTEQPLSDLCDSTPLNKFDVQAGVPDPPAPAARPAPRFDIRIARSLNWRWRHVVPIRGYFGRDGDWTNEHLWFGVELLQAGYQDPLCTIGLELVIPPRLFWVLGLLRIPCG